MQLKALNELVQAELCAISVIASIGPVSLYEVRKLREKSRQPRGGRCFFRNGPKGRGKGVESTSSDPHAVVTDEVLAGTCLLDGVK